jgi:hypothetical protein
MIVWTGNGLATIFIVLGFLFGAGYVEMNLPHGIPGVAAGREAENLIYGGMMLLAAAVVWLTGDFFHKRDRRRFVDRTTGQEFYAGGYHSLLFIPMRFWGPIIAVLTITAVTADMMPHRKAPVRPIASTGTMPPLQQDADSRTAPDRPQ